MPNQRAESEKGKTAGILSSFPAALTNPRISYFGIFALHVWIHCANKYFDYHGARPWYGDNTVWLVAFIVVVILAFWKRPNLEIPMSIDVAIAAAMAVASLFAAFGFLSGGPLVVAVASAVGGIGLAWGYLRWGLFYSKIDLKNAFACIFAAYAFGSLLKMLLVWVPDGVGIAIMVALPLLSVASWVRASCFAGDLKTVEGKRQSSLSMQGAETNSAIAKTFVLTLVYGMVVQISGAMTGTYTSPEVATASRAAEIGLSVFVIAWVFLAKKQLRVTWLWNVVIFLTATMLLMQILGAGTLSKALQSVVNSLLVMVYWVMFADLAQRSNLSPYVVFGIGRLSYSVPVFIIHMTVSFFGGEALASFSYLPVVLLYGVLLFSVFFAMNRDPDFAGTFDKLEESQPYLLQDAMEKCQILGAEKNLTDRETEIMALICSGRSKSYIAETLYLSEATIKSHARKLYIKLDVHSKAQLQKLIGL